MAAPLSRTLGDLLREQALTRGGHPAVITARGSHSFGSLFGRACQIAGLLRAQGVRRGDVVGLLMGNSQEWAEICFGVAMAGGILAPFSTWSTAQELDFLVADAGITTLFAIDRFGERDFANDVKRCRDAGVAVVMCGTDASRDFTALLDVAPSFAELPPGEGASANDDAFFLYTSGSSSTPKAVRLKHFGLIENGYNIGERQALGAADRVFLPAPLFWSFGCANALMAAFTHGATLVLAERFDAEGALDLIEQHGCTSAYLMPAMIKAMIAAPGFSPERTRSLRTGLTIGSAADFDIGIDRLGVSGLCNVYGATETYGNCAVTDHSWDRARRATTQGQPLPGQHVRIRDAKTQEIAGPGKPGAIEVGGYVTPGYQGASAALNATAFTADGYYRTGDIGKIDESGALVFIGRDTEMIKRAGINVSPAEIEDVLRSHEDLADLAVVGAPDADRDEIIVAFVVPRPGRRPAPGELAAHCRRVLSKYKVPDRFEFLEVLPLTATGKLQRRRLAEMAAKLPAVAQAVSAR